jgi:L-ascorbate metabolism protein UlaG (beta-lactamase superfamily)
MKLQLIRHATIKLQYAGLGLLIDPMFSTAEANPPIINTGNDRRNPLVPLPVPIAELVDVDAVIVTHLHPDHWDMDAVQALSKTTPIICQPGDDAVIRGQGFASVTAISETHVWGGVQFTRTGGQHGTGEIGKLMGQVSGFVLQADGEPTLYLAGDTIWCDAPRQALDRFQPDVTVVNAGGARFVEGDPITMDADDVVSVCRHAEYTNVVAVHMDAINHCLVTRTELQARLIAEGVMEQVSILADGEWL